METDQGQRALIVLQDASTKILYSTTLDKPAPDNTGFVYLASKKTADGKFKEWILEPVELSDAVKAKLEAVQKSEKPADKPAAKIDRGEKPELVK